MISLILGGMFSGKTSELLRQAERAFIAKKNVVIIRPKKDSRGYLTHSKLNTKINIEKLHKISDLKDPYQYDKIFIDEGQFFDDLSKDVLKISDKVDIIIAALNGSAEQISWLEVQALIPWAETITKLNAICYRCGSEYGSFSYYLGNDKTGMFKIGGAGEYVALCRTCLEKELSNK
jgi:thymidine kinase